MNGTTIADKDNQIELIALVNFLNKTISQYGLGFIYLLGNIGSALTCIIFSRPAFNKSPCAMFFIASNISQFFAFNFALLTRMLQFGYDVQAVNESLWFCKIRYYLFYVFVANSRYNIIMASMDRYFASSRDALRRQWSSQKIALRFIIGNTIFWFLMYTQVIVMYTINVGSCQPASGAYGFFFSIYVSIDSGILPIFLMLMFGLLTVHNVHQTRQRIEAIAANNDDRPINTNKMSRKDLQLQKMLINQICLFVILNIPNPCYLVYRAFTVNILKSPLRTTVELFINNMTYVFIYLGFALTFFNFVVSSDMFRREFQLFIQTRILRRFQRQQIIPRTGTTIRIGQTNV